LSAREIAFSNLFHVVSLGDRSVLQLAVRATLQLVSG